MKLAKYKDKERILKAARDKQVSTYKGRHRSVVTDLSTETWQARREWQEILNVLNRKKQKTNKKKHTVKDPLSSKIVIQNIKRDKSFPRRTKTEGVNDHYTSLAEDLRGTLWVENSQDYKGPDNTVTLNSYLSIITLNLSGLNDLIKRHRVSEWVKKKQDPSIWCLLETCFRPEDTCKLKLRGWRTTYHATGYHKKADVAILISDKIE